MYRGRARERALERVLRQHCRKHRCRLVLKGTFITYDENSVRDMDVAVCVECIGDDKVRVHQSYRKINS